MSNDTTRTWVHDQENSRNATIKRIKTALKNRSGKPWSVTGGKGTAWGWIRISSMPSRCSEYGRMTDADANELTQLLGLTDRPYLETANESIPSGYDYYAEYIDRAEGRTPDVYGQQYWD